MNDTRLLHIKDHLTEALLALNADIVNVSVVSACLDDARETVIDLVDGGGLSRSDANRLDAARNYINSALPLLGREWLWDSAEQFIGAALELIEFMATNVRPIRTRNGTTPEGAA